MVVDIFIIIINIISIATMITIAPPFTQSPNLRDSDNLELCLDVLIKKTFHVKQMFTCTSANVVHCTRCSRCGLLYIGETKRRL
eukprot:g40258.t1